MTTNAVIEGEAYDPPEEPELPIEEPVEAPEDEDEDEGGEDEEDEAALVALNIPQSNPQPGLYEDE